MSASLLYHAWGIRDHEYIRTTYEKGVMIFHIRPKEESLVCSSCGSSRVTRKGKAVRIFKTLPVGKKEVRLSDEIPRVKCHDCGLIRQVALSFAESRRRFTRSMERYAMDLLRHSTIQDVAAHLHLGWDTVKEIHKRFLKRRYGKPRLKHLTKIAIDEISIGKGHRYITVVLDLCSGAIVFVGNGKGADALLPFWKRLRSSGAKIEAVATDMSPAYISAVRGNLRNAALVFDRFHVMKLYNDKLTELRREMQREASTKLEEKLLKGTRWLLVRNIEDLNEESVGRRLSELERLDRALEINAPLACAYYMKEELRCFWEQECKSEAAIFLDDWLARARASGIRILQGFAKTLAGHRQGLLAWYDHPISTGPLEGTNNKIRVMQRKSYGIRDAEYLELRLFSLHRTRYALVG